MNNSLIDRGCPPLMSDGRFVTDYRPNCVFYDTTMVQNGIRNNYDMRLWLQHNAIRLQQANRNFYNRKNTCNTQCFYLPDPNSNNAFWDQYKAHLGYDNAMRI